MSNNFGVKPYCEEPDDFQSPSVNKMNLITGPEENT